LTSVELTSTDDLQPASLAPVAPGSYSFERWLRAKVESGKASRFWVAASGIPPTVTIRLGTTDTYRTPISTASPVATRQMAEGDRYMFHTLETDTYTTYLVLQAHVDPGASPGALSGVGITFGWHEG
jgi:hypothetical protein